MGSRASSSLTQHATASSTPWSATTVRWLVPSRTWKPIWTKGIDQKTGKPIDYDPNKDVQTYSGIADPTSENPVKKVCPNRTGGNNFWPSSYSPTTQLLYIPAMTPC